MLGPHVGEGVVAGVGLQHPETQEDAEGADVGDQQVEIAGPPDFRDAVVGDELRDSFEALNAEAFSGSANRRVGASRRDGRA